MFIENEQYSCRAQRTDTSPWQPVTLSSLNWKAPESSLPGHWLQGEKRSGEARNTDSEAINEVIQYMKCMTNMINHTGVKGIHKYITQNIY